MPARVSRPSSSSAPRPARHLDEPGGELEHDLQADGQYDVRVVTTDNAGNAFTSPTITIRVDNTAPTGSVTAPAHGRRGRRGAGEPDE